MSTESIFPPTPVVAEWGARERAGVSAGGSHGAGLPDEAWWLALSGLVDMGPARLGVLWHAVSGEEAWSSIGRGQVLGIPGMADALGKRAEDTARKWSRASREIDPVEVWARHSHLTVCTLDGPAMPRALADDIEPPYVLCADGDARAAEGPTVGIVGTRRCTRSGAEIAFEMGLACARAGITVVSGLAAGIDAAAHAGALSAGADAAPPVAVVGCGLDIHYPRKSREVWEEVVRRGVVFSEYPLGTPPARWRFPARNRLVAALSQVMLVVESPRRGGSMYTVNEALERDRTVLAVPGSIRSPASAGSNWVLSQGAHPACSAEDVITAVGMSPGEAPSPSPDARPRLSGAARDVLDALGWEPVGLDSLALRTSLDLGSLAVAVETLVAQGWARHEGGFVERLP